MSDAAWLARRAQVVRSSMTRHRLVKGGAPLAPIGLANKFGALYKAVMHKRMTEFAIELLKAKGFRADGGRVDAGRDIGGILFHYADTIIADLSKHAGSLVNEVSSFNKGQVGAVFQRIVGVPFTDTPRLERLLDNHLSDNIALIKNMTAQSMAEVRALVDHHQGGDLNALISDIQDRVGVSASRAELIARDQTLKLNGNLTKERNTEAGIERYEWVSSHDERVRPFHSDLDNTEHDWTEPPVIDKKGRREHPGGDYQCRCTANPIIDLDKIAAKNGAPEIPPTWADKTKPEFSADEHADFERAPVGFISRWQHAHTAKGVNPYTGPTWFGKPQRAMTPSERQSLASASSSLKGAHGTAVESGRRAKLSEAAQRALDTRTKATVQAAREARAILSGDSWVELDGVRVQLKDVPDDRRADVVWVNPATGARVFPFLM